MTMTEQAKVGQPLNPALKQTEERVHATDEWTPAPIDSVSTKERKGDGWPLIWLVVAVACLAITAYLII
ncbi:hypothetical protein ADT71_26590 [Novosphingobium sp. ST904]|nr:hypothetical protein ADT71_26590 [Novosphingobium sp. ST904]